MQEPQSSARHSVRVQDVPRTLDFLLRLQVRLDGVRVYSL